MDVTTGAELPVSALISDTVLEIEPGATMAEVARQLSEQDVGALVIRGGALVEGIVSERDIVRAIAEGKDPTRTSALDVGHRKLHWCDASSTVASVATEMMDRYVRHILVEDEGRLVGVVSARDLLGAYAASTPPL